MIPYLVSYLENRYPAVGDRVYSMIVPQLELFPVIRLTESSLMPDSTKEPVSALDTHHVQLDIFSRSYADAHTLSRQIRKDLDRNHYQPQADPTVSGIVVKRIRDGEYDKDKALYHRIIDLTIYTHHKI